MSARCCECVKTRFLNSYLATGATRVHLNTYMKRQMRQQIYLQGYNNLSGFRMNSVYHTHPAFCGNLQQCPHWSQESGDFTFCIFLFTLEWIICEGTLSSPSHPLFPSFHCSFLSLFLFLDLSCLTLCLYCPRSPSPCLL